MCFLTSFTNSCVEYNISLAQSKGYFAPFKHSRGLRSKMYKAVLALCQLFTQQKVNQGYSKCKGPEVSASLLCSKTAKGQGAWVGVGGDGVREVGL